MYISGGSNVYPREVEEELLVHPDVLEVAVLRPGAAPDEAGLLRWMEGRVARYKQPRQAFFWPELPKSGYGKVAKIAIREELLARRRAVAESGARRTRACHRLNVFARLTFPPCDGGLRC